MDCYYSGRNVFRDQNGKDFNDMALALGMYSDDIDPVQAYLGWFKKSFVSGWGTHEDEVYFSRLWSCSPDPGLGSPNSLKQALIYADQFKPRIELPGQLEIYGNCYEESGYSGLEQLYFTPDN